jgi:hypothetical protein
MGKLKIKLTFGSCKKGSKPIEEKVGGGLRWRGVPITNSLSVVVEDLGRRGDTV